MADDAERSSTSSEAAETGIRESSEVERPRPELRWVQIRDPKKPLELGRNGRAVGSFFHEGYDSWEVLLVTYEGELGEEK